MQDECQDNKTHANIDARLAKHAADVSDMRHSIETIKENHLAHIEKSIGALQINYTEIKTDVGWLKQFFWIVATASIGGLIASVFGVILSMRSK